MIHVVADAAYHGPALRDLPGNVTWTCRVPRNAVLYGLAPPRTGRRGRPRTRGDRLGTAGDIAAAAAWATVTVTAYGREQVRHVTEVTCLWYGSWHTRPVRLILSRDEHTTGGYDLAHRHLVRPARPRPGRHRRPPRRTALVPRQDRARLRGHAHQAAPDLDRSTYFRHPPSSAHQRANPRRARSLGRSRRITTKLQRAPDEGNNELSGRSSSARAFRRTPSGPRAGPRSRRPCPSAACSPRAGAPAA
jgi:hypothetical protein